MSKEDPSLVEVVDAFLKARDMSPVTFGRSALNDPHFVRQLREGRRVWPETEAKVRDFMAKYGAEHTAPSASVDEPPAVDAPPFGGTTEGRSLPPDIAESDRPNGVDAPERIAA